MALLLLQQSRAPARFDAAGELVLLDDQDRGLWNRTFIAEGRRLLERAGQLQNPGPYQIQAATAALHATASRPEDTSWKEIDLLYQSLEALQPSPVVTLNRAVAVWKLQGAAVVLELIEPLTTELDGYFYFHGLRAILLKQLNLVEDARIAFRRAIALARSVAEANHIRHELDHLADA